jgi:PAS domain S-box-containing protein
MRPTRPRAVTNKEALILQPEWCRVSLASIGDGLITADSEGKVTFLNSVAESLTGWPLQEALGQPLDSVFRIVNEESRQPVESPTVRALREDGIVGLAHHTLLIAKDGTKRRIDDSAPIRNDKGEAAGVVLVFRDISARRLAERQVQDALSYSKSIIATLREPFLVVDASLRVKTANAAFYRTFHVSREKTEGRFIYDLGNRQWDIPRLRELLEKILPQNHSLKDYEVEHDFPTLGRKIMLLNAHRFKSVDSGPNLILLAIEDITERKQAAAAVQNSELRYRRLFETAQDAIIIIDARSGKITDANPYIQQLLGYSLDEFLGKELWELGVFEDKAAIRSAFLKLQAEGYIRFDHLPLQTKSGERVEVEFVSNAYQVSHHRVIQCNIRDISARRRLEQQAKDQAQALADLHRRKDEFLAMLSHELRNPLAPIMNAVQLLRLQKNESGLQQQARSIIQRQVGQLVALVDDLLEVSRIATGRIHLHLEQLDMRSIVEHAVETVHPLIGQRRHVLTMHVSPSPIRVHGDATRLEQMVVNLLNNAAKYSDEGSQLWLSLQQEEDEAVLKVRDSGVGIAPELLPHIFDLFTQAERSLARSQGGLGIGLALVQRLVEMHGGKVEAYSALGQGSEFVVRLPVSQASASPLPASPTEKAPPTGRSVRVLVVDDNVDTADSLAMLMGQLGHDVRTAHDGQTALQAILDDRPDVVFLDIGLPALNGYEVAQRVRQQPVLQNVVLVAMTGYGQESDRQRSRDAGFDHHLVKPADVEKLLPLLAIGQVT